MTPESDVVWHMGCNQAGHAAVCKQDFPRWLVLTSTACHRCGLPRVAFKCQKSEWSGIFSWHFRHSTNILKPKQSLSSCTAKSSPPPVCLVIVILKVKVTALLSASVYGHFVYSISASTHVVWLQRYQLYRKYMTDKDSKKFWTFTVILTRAIFKQDSQANKDVSTK